MGKTVKGKKKYMLDMMKKLLPCKRCGANPHACEYGAWHKWYDPRLGEEVSLHIVEIYCSNKKCGCTEAWSRKQIKNAIKAWNEREETKSPIKVIDMKNKK
jgi:hypothetical protein